MYIIVYELGRIHIEKGTPRYIFQKVIKSPLYNITITSNNKIMLLNIYILQKGVHFFPSQLGVFPFLASLEQKGNTFWEIWNVEYN